MNDPRQEDARHYTTEGGKVTGVELKHIPVEGSKWELIDASLINEVSAQGTTIARVIVRDKNGVDSQVNCFLAWPWKNWQPSSSFENKLLPGSVNYPYQHVISNKYDAPAEQGPLAIYIGDQDGKVMSDVIGGFGLPHGHHIGFHLVFRERLATSGHTGGTDTGVIDHLKRIESKLDQIARHLGVTLG